MDYSTKIMDLRDKAIRTHRIINKLEDILILAPEKFTPEMAVLLDHYNAKLTTIKAEKAHLEIERALSIERSI